MKKNISLISCLCICALVFSLFSVQAEVASASSTHEWQKNKYIIHLNKSKDYKISVQTLTNKGDATYIVKKGSNGTKRILVDTGYSYANVAKKISNKKMDFVLLTHNHVDHIGGFGAFKSNGIKIDRLLYNNFYRSATEKTTKVKGMSLKAFLKSSAAPSIKHKIRLVGADKENKDNGRVRNYSLGDNCRLVIFPPLPVKWKNSPINNRSMIAVLDTPKERIVFGGDIMGDATKFICNISKKGSRYSNYSSEAKDYLFSDKNHIVYKVSHHATGSDRYYEKKISITRAKADRLFIKKIKADALVVTGFVYKKAGNIKNINPLSGYFKTICKNGKEIKGVVSKTNRTATTWTPTYDTRLMTNKEKDTNYAYKVFGTAGGSGWPKIKP